MFCEKPKITVRITNKNKHLFLTSIAEIVYVSEYYEWLKNPNKPLPSPDYFKHILIIPCGKCIFCRAEQWREWRIRCYLEAQEYDHNQFITLTYDNQHLPQYGVYHSEITRFVKNIRERFRRKYKIKGIRFYGCGTYDENGRAHYHLILFNCPPFGDEKFYKKNEHGQNLYTSEIVSRSWGNGFCVVSGVVNRSVCNYVTRYIMDNHSDGNYPFQSMSTQPGIGSAYFNRHFDELIKDGEIKITGTVKERLPHYYERKIKERLGEDVYNKTFIEPRVAKAQAAIAAEMQRTGLTEDEVRERHTEAEKAKILKEVSHYRKSKKDGKKP